MTAIADQVFAANENIRCPNCFGVHTLKLQPTPVKQPPPAPPVTPGPSNTDQCNGTEATPEEVDGAESDQLAIPPMEDFLLFKNEVEQSHNRYGPNGKMDVCHAICVLEILKMDLLENVRML